ncbi:hypothetical protein ABIA35_006020 [Catenulispora sp. MAP12-49]|uniref:hypothetical protein n=1 Tax=Catenulispora sp. MAP12-49 TaxID=3156302 RepID=UPI0035142924
MSARKVWTEADIRALGVRTDGVTAVQLVYGVGRTRAYEILRSGVTDFRVIKVPGSNRYVVPTSEILRLLFGDAGVDPLGATSDSNNHSKLRLLSAADADPPGARAS